MLAVELGSDVRLVWAPAAGVGLRRKCEVNLEKPRATEACLGGCGWLVDMTGGERTEGGGRRSGVLTDRPTDTKGAVKAS